MRGFEGFLSNEVIINQKQIILKYKVHSLKIIEDKIFVVVFISNKEEKEAPKDDLNNVFCYDYDGNLLWQINTPKFEGFPNFIQSIISIMDYDRNKNKLYAYDWMERLFEVDINTGKILSFSVPRNNPKIYYAKS